jgi:pilus assembly protein CpaF
MSTDEISMDTTSPRTSPRSESEDARASFISAVAFVVERVCAQLSPAELGSPNAARRVDPLIESLLRELKQNPGVTQPGGAERVRDLARAELLDTGPLAELLDDPSVSEISASGAGYVAVVRGLQRVEVPIPFCAAGSLDRAVERLCAQEGVPLKPAERMAQRVLASSGFELHVMRGDLSPQGAVVHLRRRDGVSSTLEDLVRQGTVSRTVANFLQQCAMGGANMLVVGKARSGATEVLSALASAVPGERTLVLADDRDLADGASRAMAIQQGRGVELAPLFSTIANLPGHRLVVDGLLRADRALALVRAGLEGAEGMAAGLRARSIERGIGQICSQIAIANSGMSVAGVADAIVATFDLALEVARLPDGRSRVVRVAELGRGDATPVAAYDVFRFTVERIATGGAVEGSFSPTGRRPAFAEELQSRGARMDTGMFGRASRAPYP